MITHENSANLGQAKQIVRPLPPGSKIEYMGEPATVVADNGGPSFIVEINGIRQERLWCFDGTECTVLEFGKSGTAFPFARWETIVTAPLDETRVLLYRPGYAEDIAICWWNSATREWVSMQGILFSAGTHWMPLPERPNMTATLMMPSADE